MEDSVVKIEEKPKTSTEIVVKNSDGVTFSTRIKGPDGKFKKKERPLPSSKEIIRLGRNLLNSAEAGPDGKPIQGTKTRHRKIFDNLMRIATSETNDPKALMAVIKAAELIYLRYLGKPSVSDEEMEALKINGVKVVVVQPLTLKNSSVVEVEEEPSKPSFIDAEILEDKK